jgi:hypothetical protein
MLDELVSTLMGNGSDELDMECEDSIYVQRNVLSNPMSLLELSAQAVAKHCSCSVLEQHSPPLDEQLLRKVCISLAMWSFVRLFSEMMMWPWPLVIRLGDLLIT